MIQQSLGVSEYHVQECLIKKSFILKCSFLGAEFSDSECGVFDGIFCKTRVQTRSIYFPDGISSESDGSHFHQAAARLRGILVLWKY